MIISDDFMRSSLGDAYTIASSSPDPSNQVGAIVYTQLLDYLSGSNNHFLGLGDVANATREQRYAHVCHAESSALLKALRVPERRSPFLMVAPWSACSECAKDIVTANIRVLVRHKQVMERTPDRWRESIDFGDELMIQAGVQIMEYDGFLGCQSIINNGEVWQP